MPSGPRSSPTQATALLIVAAVVLPALAIGWLLLRGVHSERLASEHRLMRAQQTELQNARASLENHWQQLDARVNGILRGASSPATRFHRLLTVADSAILLDENQEVSYPNRPQPPILTASPADAAMKRAGHLESIGDLATAAERFSILSRDANPHRIARALLGQARCFAKSGQGTRAAELIQTQLLREKLADARDSSGRLIAPAAQLMAIRLIDNPDQLIAHLGSELRNYNTAMPSNQRLFLINEVLALAAGTQFPTHRAETLAQNYLRSQSAQPSGLNRSGSDIWTYRGASPCILLFRGPKLQASLQSVLGEVRLLAPGVSPAPGNIAISAGNLLPEWQLSTAVAVDSAPNRYVTTGLVILLIVLACGLLAALNMRTQLRLAQLKHSLVTTVSHELKTPLASTQMLVETLLGDLELPHSRQREYLRTIARENQRLSRLVESFLTFSRMEQDRHQFRIQPTCLQEIADSVQASINTRPGSAGCDFAIELDCPSALVHADLDAIVTALLNLIGNAAKYSDDSPWIRLTIQGDSTITFAVSDHGVGLSPRAARAVFRQFYQVDQSLTREQDGCGLGLSIVRYIMRAHDSQITVDSEPGKGSCFSFTLPRVRDLI